MHGQNWGQGWNNRVTVSQDCGASAELGGAPQLNEYISTQLNEYIGDQGGADKAECGKLTKCLHAQLGSLEFTVLHSKFTHI